MGDAATSVISLFLLPLFQRFLSPEDYGVIYMLLLVEAGAKVIFRWGLDTAFMRLYFDEPDDDARRQLASTIFHTLLAANGTLLVLGAAASGWLSTLLIGTPVYGSLVGLTLFNTFLANFFFIPYHVIRIRQQPKTFIRLTFTRSVATVVARVVFVMLLGMGVFGFVVADLAATVLMIGLLFPWYRRLIRPVFSRARFRAAFDFGLPRVPHSLAQQVVGGADRYLLNRAGDLAAVGLYGTGTTFGAALKICLSAFEFAWTPFFLAAMKERDARAIYRQISTYIVAALVLLVAAASAVSPVIVRLFTVEAFHEAARVTPWIMVSVLFQGLYLVGSIGLVITKRTRAYPVATGIAALVAIAANLILIPRFGMIGAAWANVGAYATLTLVTGALSYRAYPIEYEWARLTRIAVAGILGFVAGHAVLTSGLSELAAAPLSLVAVAAVYAAVLLGSGFMRPGEALTLRELVDRARRARS